MIFKEQTRTQCITKEQVQHGCDFAVTYYKL